MKTNKMKAENKAPKDKFQEFIADDNRRKLYEQESLAFDAVEMIAHLMAENKVSKAELARRVGKTRSDITQLLAGTRNLTLYTLADLAFALGSRLEFKARPCKGRDEETSEVKTYQMYRFQQQSNRPTYVADETERKPHVGQCVNVGA